jgi:hypothetical protein
MTNEGLLPQNQKLTIIPTGIKRHQHDLNCEDAGCEEVVNLRFKNGSWRTVGEKTAVWSWDHGCALLYYHAYINEKNGTDYYVGVAYEGLGLPNLYLVKPTAQTKTSIKGISTDPSETVLSVTSLNSILIVTTADKELIFNWDNDTSAYVELSKDICPDISFQYQVSPDATDWIIITGGDYKEFDTQAELFDQILIEKYKKRQKGLFSHCWIMIQWAFRLWDGSYIRHSQPFLLKLSNGTPDYWQTLVEAAKYHTILETGIPKFYINMPTAVRANLEHYKGLISDLCVFMSQDVSQYLCEYNGSPYTTDGVGHRYAFSDNTDSLHQLVNLYPYYLAKEVKYSELMESDNTTKFEINLNEVINKLNFSGDGGENIDTVEKIPVRHNTYSFKRLGGGNWLNLLYGGFGALTKNGNWNKVWYTQDDAEQTVEATDEAGSFILQSQPELPVDDFSNHTLIGNATPYIYNAKLHKGNINVRFGNAPQFSEWNAFTGYTLMPAGDMPGIWTFYREVKIVTDLGDRYVREVFTPYLQVNISSDMLRIPPIVSYPDARATRIRIIIKKTGDANYYEMASFELKSHKIYNYAYCITNETTTGADPEYLLFDFTNIVFTNNFPASFPNVCGVNGIDAMATDDRYYLDKNRVQVSRINNALYYPSMYSYQFGNSETVILAFGSQSAPISPGQFGQFPLSVFTSQGIFLMQQGGGDVIYSAIVPLNNEVAFKNSICELGGAIVYASRDGLKILSGNRLQHISREVEGVPSDKLINDSYYINFITNADGHLVNLYQYLSEEDFLTYLDENVRVCYDKMNKELIISNRDLFTDQGRNSSSGYSYVYNLPYKTWHKITDTWHQFILVNSRWVGLKNYRAGYTTGLGAQYMDGETSVLQDCMIQSRPMKWGSYEFKKMRTIVQRSLCCVGDILDSPQDADDKFGMYMFASLENNIWKFVKGIKVSQTFGMIQHPTLGSNEASVRQIVLLTAVKSKDMVFSHWEILRGLTNPDKLGTEARHDTENLLGEYDAQQYGESYDIGISTENLP